MEKTVVSLLATKYMQNNSKMCIQKIDQNRKTSNKKKERLRETNYFLNQSINII